MPLARIFTRYPERATALSGQLEQQGYRVEVSGPDQTHLPPADLEIEFEVCDRADVLQRAAHLADELQADVAVAPGVLQPEPQTLAKPLPATSAMHTAELPAIEAQTLAEVLPMEAAAVQSPAEVVPAELAAFVPETALQDDRDREREFESAFSPVSAGTKSESETDHPLTAETGLPEDEMIPPAVVSHRTEDALPPVAMLEEETSGMRAEPVMSSIEEFSIEEPVVETAPAATLQEAARPADPVPYLAQLAPFGKSTEQAQMEAAEYRAAHAPDQRLRKDSGTKPAGESAGRNVASIFSTAMTGLKSASASTAASFRERVQEYKKRAQVRSAEAHAARVARMLDLEQRKAEAQQRAAELEAAREAASARLLELVRERQPGLSEEDRKTAPVSDSAPPIKPVESLRHASIARMQPKQRKPISPQLRAVLTGAAAVTLIFVIGIVLGEFYPRTPLANPADHASNGVTVKGGAPVGQPGGVTVQGGAPAGASGVTVTTGSAAQVRPAVQPQASATISQTAGPAKPSPRVAQARHLDEQTMGDDVVIRHFSRPVTRQKAKPTPQQAGLKHFSDMEN